MHANKRYGIIARDLRLAQKMTQAELGEKIGRSKQWVCEFEKGKYGLKVDMLTSLVTALGTEASIFLPAK